MNSLKDTHKNQQLTSVQILAEKYLEEIGFLNISSERTVLAMKKEFIVNAKSVDIIVIIKDIFPLEYPSFYIKDESMFLLYPHIEQKKKNIDAQGICLFDENDKFYYENVEFLLNDNINKLESFLDDINNGKFTFDEIFEEFDSYWNNTGLFVNYNKDFVKQYDNLKLLDIFISRTNQNLMLIDEPEIMDNFFKVSKIPYEKNKIIYLDLKDKFLSKIPSTFKEFLGAIEAIGLLEEFKKLRKHKKLFDGILFSFKLPNGDEHFSFLYIQPSRIKTNRKSKVMNPIANLLSPIRLNRKIEGGTAKDISSTRIYTRGGNEMNKEINNKEKRIAIVGCGSIGASLAYKLLKVGCTNLLLVDPDRLSVDNISRHLLGMEYVNINKAIALENFLSKQFLKSDIKGIDESVVSCYEELKSCDLIISAVGSEARIIETKMILDANTGELPNVISCWVEANAIAGHSILFNKNSIKGIGSISNAIEDIFNSIILLKNEYGENLKKDDVGCNSSYMPYSSLDSEGHVTNFSRMIIKHILGQNIKPIFSSIGDLTTVKNHLKDSCTDIESFSLQMKELSA